MKIVSHYVREILVYDFDIASLLVTVMNYLLLDVQF